MLDWDKEITVRGEPGKVLHVYENGDRLVLNIEKDDIYRVKNNGASLYIKNDTVVENKKDIYWLNLYMDESKRNRVDYVGTGALTATPMDPFVAPKSNLDGVIQVKMEDGVPVEANVVYQRKLRS